MADFKLVLLNTGKTYLADFIAGRTSQKIDGVQLGRANRTVLPTDTGPTTPFNPARTFSGVGANPTFFGSAAGGDFQFEFVERDQAAYSVGEVYIFAGNIAVWGASNADGDLYAKPAGTDFRLQVQGSYSDVEITTAMFASAMAAPRATENIPGLVLLASGAEIVSNSAPESAVTSGGLRYWWDRVRVASTKLTGLIPVSLIPSLPASILSSGKLLASRYDFATKAEAEAGTNTTKPMNSQRTKEAIEALSPTPSLTRTTLLNAAWTGATPMTLSAGGSTFDWMEFTMFSTDASNTGINGIGSIIHSPATISKDVWDAVPAGKRVLVLASIGQQYYLIKVSDTSFRGELGRNNTRIRVVGFKVE